MPENYLAMLPTELLERMTAMLGNSRHADFYRAEAEFWRGEAQRYKAALEPAARCVERVLHGASVPPEPPPGTQFTVEGVRVWFRGDLGWYCANEECPNCPAEWDEAYSRIPVNAVRTLPGGRS